MRVGLNLLYLIPGEVGGTETYAVGLIKGLSAVDHQNEYVLFLNRESDKLELARCPNFQSVTLSCHARSRPLRYAWEQLLLPWELAYHRIDVVHSLGYIGPLFTHCPAVVTIPDLNFIALRGTIPEVRRQILEFFSASGARRATRIITISEFSKSQITAHLSIPSDKVTVTHLGPGWDATVKTSWEAVRERYQLPPQYLTAISGKSAHKNIARLLRAFQKSVAGVSHKLVIIGNLPADLDVRKQIANTNIQDRVLLLGYVPSSDLFTILSHADLFVMPSLYEGFGLPVLEAQLAGAAVACSSAGSLPEVANGSAVLFDPNSTEDMADAISQTLSDAALRARLRRAGAENLRRFSWEKTALQTMSVYEDVYRARHERHDLAPKGRGSRDA